MPNPAPAGTVKKRIREMIDHGWRFGNGKMYGFRNHYKEVYGVTTDIATVIKYGTEYINELEGIQEVCDDSKINVGDIQINSTPNLKSSDFSLSSSALKIIEEVEGVMSYIRDDTDMMQLLDSIEKAGGVSKFRAAYNFIRAMEEEDAK